VKNGISLGVFNLIENAERLQAKFNGQGYRTKTWRQQLTLFALTADIPIDDLLISKTVTDAGYLIQDCG
jgi:hypothetical protein